MSWMKVNRWKVVELNLYEIERIGWEMNEMSEMNLRRVSVSPYESEWESPYQKVPMRVSVKVPIKMSLSNWVWNVPIEMSISESPYQIVPIKLSISNCPHQNINSTFYDSNCSSIGTRVSFNSTTYYQINHTHWSQWAFEELGGFTW